MEARNARVLYLPNERGDFRQLGMRRALAKLVEEGVIGDARIFSLLWRVREREGSAARDALHRLVETFRPDVILFQHIAGAGLVQDDYDRIRQSSGATLVYHEADPYGRFMHRLPLETRVAGSNADVVFTVGEGVFSENFRRLGASDVRWAPHTYDWETFDVLPEQVVAEKSHDVVMIANRNTPRLWFRALPDARARRDLVALLSRRLGSRFAVYGRGWEGESAKGPLPFWRQGEAIRSAWVSANWDHYADEPLYFSDRLPISLASGTIHATSSHPGYEELFGELPFLIYESSVRDLVERIETRIRDSTPEDRLESARAGLEWAHVNLRQDQQFVGFLAAAQLHFDDAAVSRALDRTRQPWLQM